MYNTKLKSDQGMDASRRRQGRQLSVLKHCWLDNTEASIVTGMFKNASRKWALYFYEGFCVLHRMPL